MSGSSGEGKETLDVSLLAKVIDVCDHFEGDFRQGRSPRIEDYLADSSDSIRPAMIRELVALEVELRRSRGERPELGDYLGRFPEKNIPTLAFEIERPSAEATEHAPASPEEPRSRDRVIPKPTIPGYMILEELGRGAMGVVYKARQNRLNRLCALKMILAGDHAGPEAGLRFLAEAEAVARLQHPGVVQIFGINEHNGHPYLELEYVDGGNLATAIAGTPRSARSAAALIEAIALAIGEAHRRGIVHRDLKPGNILLTSDGRPKVADFGLAKFDVKQDGMTRTNSVLGTPSYMAPEQAQGRTKDAGPAADIYSLGAIFYELLTGRPPFRAPTILQTLEQVKNSDPVPPSRLVPGLSRDAETICLTCLEKDPGRRYASAEALSEDLRRFWNREPIRARRIGAAGLAWRWCRRRPAVAGLLASMLAIVSIGSLILLRQQQKYVVDIEGQRSIALLNEANARQSEAKAVQSASEARKEHQNALVETSKIALERGTQSCEQGEIGLGLVWMARSLELVPYDMNELRWAIRAKMAHWRLGLTTLDRVIGLPFEVNIARYSPDGSRILTGMGLYYSNRPHSALLLDAATGRPIGPPLEHEGAVMDAAFSPDGRVVYTLSMDRSTRAWDAVNGQLLRVITTSAIDLKAPIWGEDLALAPDGEHLAISEGKIARIRRVDSGESIGEPMVHGAGILDLEWSPDGKLIASAAKDGTVTLWDGASGTLIRKINSQNGGYVYSATFSPNGLHLLVAGTANTVQVFQVATGVEVTQSAFPTHRAAIGATAFHPGGRMFATASGDGDVRMTDLASGRAIGHTLPHVSGLWSVSFGPGGRSLLTSGEDKTVRLFSIPEGYTHAPFIPHGHSITTASFNPFGGPEVFTGSRDGLARGWDADGQPTGPNARPGWPINRIHYRPDNKTLLTVGSFTARLWDVTTGAPLPGSVPLFQYTPGHHSGILCSAFSHDAKEILTGTSNKTVERWDAATGCYLGTLLQTTDSVNALACSPDGKEMVTGDWSGHVQRWDQATRQKIGKPIQHGNKIIDIAYNPKGTLLLTCGLNGIAQLWRISDMKRVGRAMKHQSEINRARFSPDGRIVATASEDGNARLWDVETSTPLGPPIRHKGQVKDLDFRPDGRALLTVTMDGSIHVWDMPKLPIDDAARLKSWSQVASGLGMDEEGVIRPLDAEDWRQCSDELAASGGSPFLAPGYEKRGANARADLWSAIEAVEAFDVYAARWHFGQYLANPSRGNRGESSILLNLGDAMTSAKDADSALKAFREAVRLAPDAPDAHLHLGLALLKQDRFQALYEFREMGRLRPFDAEAYLMMGVGLDRAGELEDAINAMRKALELRPDLSLARVQLAHFLARRVERRRASAFARLAADGMSRLATFIAEIGQAWSQKERHNRAIAAFEVAVWLDPDCIRGHEGLALEFRLRESSGVEKPEALARELRAIAQRYPQQIDALINLGVLLQARGDVVGAARSFRNATLIRPEDHNAQARLANALNILRDYKGALEAYDRAIVPSSEEARVLNDRAWLLATCPDTKLRDGKRAVKDALRAVELSHSQDASILYTLAAALAEDGRLEEAVRYQKLAVSLDNQDDSKKQLALYEQRMHDEKSAPAARR